MTTASSVTLTRDCQAIQIPAGTSLTLPAGTPVTIAQTLGGSYTVQTDSGLFRIASKDADALGLAKEEANQPLATATARSAEPVTEAQVWETLKSCYDPEIPVNIVDLGLVYHLAIEPLPTGQSRVAVKMTLTAMGCGMGATIAADAEQKILQLPGVADASVEIVWDPPWNPGLISPTGRAMLGLD